MPFSKRRVTVSIQSIIVIIMAMLNNLQASVQSKPDIYQTELFRESTKCPIGIMTTSAGACVPYSQATNALNTRIVSNEFFMEYLSHNMQERLPERVVHAKGAGASGYFEVTNNITSICRAKLFNKDGKRTPIVVRFSSILNQQGASDTNRDGRGFAVKFYTEDGNFNLLTLSIPVFVIKDPILFPTFIRSMKRNPATGLVDPNMMWDFLTLHPESFHMFLFIFADLGIPYSYRHMPGFSIQSFQVENEKGEIYFIRFHFVPNSGLRALTSEQARIIAGFDADYYARDLYRAIGTGMFPVWNVSIQVFTLEDVNEIGSSLFDVTRVIPTDMFPLQPLGKIVLNKNPLNHFAEVEQLAMNPANLVDGISGGPDILFQTRRHLYREALSYRLGTNFNKILINYPHQTQPLDYNRDGRPPVGFNGKDSINYFPNSFNGAIPCEDNNRKPLIKIFENAPNNIDQCRDLYLRVSNDERNRITQNIIYSLKKVVKFIQAKAIDIFSIIHPDLGRRVAEGLYRNNTRFLK